MTAISWKNPVNGDWSDASDWSTGTVPGSGDAVTISVVSSYIVTISSADHASSLTFNMESPLSFEGEAALFENAGSLTMAGALTVDGGFVSLNEANTIGSIAVAAGVLAFGNAGALGAGTISMSGGELLGTANETLGNALALSGSTTIAAAHGTTLNLTGNVSFAGSGNTVVIGAPGEDGEVVWSGTITSGNTLQLGTGASTSSIGGGAITDNGSLTIDNNNAFIFTNAISGAGVLEQLGTGVTTINTRNVYGGGTFLSAGTLAIGSGGALGAGSLNFTGGELLATATETFVNPITFPDSSTTTTFAAAHGTTLNLTGNVTFAGSNTVVIGAPGQDGDVVWSGAASGSTTGDAFDLLDGTLTAGSSILQVLLANSTGVTIAAGATLDWAGNFSDIYNLQGAGTVTNSGAAQTMPLVGTTNFSGTISGALSIDFLGNVLLSGLEDYTGDAQFGGQFTAANAGTYDIVSDNGITGNPADFFINNGLFEKTGGSGVSAVTSDFVNNGTITVSSGSIQFSGGFTNNGIVQGVLSESGGVWTVTAGTSNAPPPAATTADMILRNTAGGSFEIYDLGSNAVLAADPLPLMSGWQVAGLGGFNGADTTDMMLRDNAGAFEVCDISNNNITSVVAMGQVGLEWAIAGFGDFSSQAGETDMLLRNSSTGAFEIYDISNNQITSAAAMGQVGLEWSVAGFGDFSTRPNETDMLMRNNNTGAFEIYDISSNQITSAASMGQVGLEWSVAGFSDFSGNAKETDMLMRNGSTGAFEIYDISSNQITSAAAMGQVGLEWSVAGFGPINGAGASDLLLRNTNTGAFEIYDIANNQITSAAPMGQVGLEWSVAGIAADPPGMAPANTQLVQAMASMGSSAPISAANAAPIGAETSIQTPLTMPQPG